MRFRKPGPGSAKFLLIAFTLIVALDWLAFGDKPRHYERVKADYLEEQAQQAKLPEKPQDLEPATYLPPLTPQAPSPQKVTPEDGSEYFESAAPPKVPHWKENAVPAALQADKAKIAIVIDDLGMNVSGTNALIELSPPLTLAFLPYAKKTRELAKKAKKAGHELLIHTPMEPMNPDLDLGDMHLLSDMSAQEFAKSFEDISQSFEGYTGINNHMGSRLTQDPRAMKQLMGILKDKELIFIDSRTIHTSIAAETAMTEGVPYAIRDVFLDHENTDEFVLEALRKTERIAKDHGQAIAIGHPKDVTINALKNWIPTLESRGFQLVPVSALIKTPSEPERF